MYASTKVNKLSNGGERGVEASLRWGSEDFGSFDPVLVLGP